MQVESIVVTKCEHLLLKAIHFGASDIHILPTEQNYAVMFRKYSKLIAVDTMPVELGTRMISYFKFLSSLDISERRKPQSGAFHQQFDQQAYAFRVSTLPSSYQKESLVIRILLQHVTLPIDELCVPAKRAQKLTSLVEHAQGLLLFTGATGTGKTTSLYSLIHYCSQQLNRHVISLEDPVERTQQQVLQIQVNERAGITYASGLRAILRHSPDVIMIGEIRDQETAHIAVEAALTGHLVLSTVHAKNTVNCIYRLLDLEVSLEKLRQTVVGIVAQTLITLPHLDERKAIVEILHDARLQQAFDCIARNEQYELPKGESLQEQLAFYKDGRYANYFT